MKFDVKNPVYVVFFTALVSACFTAAIMVLQVATAGQVERNQALRGEKALVKVFHLGEVDRMGEDEIRSLVRRRIDDTVTLTDPESGRSFTLFRAYSTEGRPGEKRSGRDLVGLAFPVEGMGFWDRITGLMALSPDLKKTLGVVFLDQKETPGLGGRIMEKKWQEKFRGLKVFPAPPGRNIIYISGTLPEEAGDPRYGRTVDAITGATQTSMAVERLINESLRRFHRAYAAWALRRKNQN